MSTGMELITLQAGAMRLGLAPLAGGSVAFLRHGETDLLRPAGEGLTRSANALDGAGFPMLPFCGRIRDGAFTFEGRSHRLAPNFPPEAHAIHGHGWQSAWTAEAIADTSASLWLSTPADAPWPWAMWARQDFVLRPDGLELTLSLGNADTTPMPAAMGWHPYFPREGAWLQADTQRIWRVDEANPHGAPHEVGQSEDLRAGSRVAALDLDHAFTVASPGFTVRAPTHTLRVDADPVFGHMIVFVPGERDFFCAEPITAAPDAVNSPFGPDITGLRTLAPGEVLEGRVRVRVQTA
jgi:aldose 1-epimerase